MNDNYKIYMASDHAGLLLKKHLTEYFPDLSIEDLGPYSDESVDYPDFAQAIVDKVSNDSSSKGILICGSGIGMSIAANRNPKIRGALCRTLDDARLCREHNDANVIIFAARVNSNDECAEMLKIFLNTEFEGGRHQRRVSKLTF
ncbi:ribose 5-phosphate isomerase B [Bacteriovoracaceae bacterium]|nr:ribose 5-phosphate isomerase B [Bacteriovoracaceae bacterium]